MKSLLGDYWRLRGQPGLARRADAQAAFVEILKRKGVLVPQKRKDWLSRFLRWLYEPFDQRAM